MRLPPSCELGALGERVGDVALDLRDRGLVDQRPDLHAFGEPVGDLQPGGRLGEGADEVVVDAVLDEEAVGRDARLAGVPELAHHRAGDRLGQVGVVEDDERRVAAELERDLLHLAGALGHQELADLRRAGEAELADDRVGRHLAADRGCVGSVAGDDREDAGGTPASSASAAIASAVSGVCSAGLSTIVQPTASAGADLRVGIAAGKFQGVMPGGDADRLAQHDDPPVGRGAAGSRCRRGASPPRRTTRRTRRRTRSRASPRRAACPARGRAARPGRRRARSSGRRGGAGSAPGPSPSGASRRAAPAAAASIARRVSAAPMPRHVGDRRAGGGVDDGKVSPESASTHAPST